MESFAFFYEYSDENKIEADLHMNLWLLKDDNIFIDIGFKIKNTANINKIFIHFPFDISKDNISDLSDKLKNPKTVSLIFNDDCPVKTNCITIDEVDYSIIKINKDKIDNLNPNVLSIDIESIKKENTYLRFRVKSDTLKEKIIYSKDKILNLFKPHTESYNIIDIKINKKRNFDYEEYVQQEKEKRSLFNFDKIHFLLMDYINHNVVFLSRLDCEARILEKDWDEYIEPKKSELIENLVAYHFKSIKKEDIDNELSILMKTLKSSVFPSIILYIITTILMGIVSGVISSIISNIFFKR